MPCHTCLPNLGQCTGGDGICMWMEHREIETWFTLLFNFCVNVHNSSGMPVFRFLPEFRFFVSPNLCVFCYFQPIFGCFGSNLCAFSGFSHQFHVFWVGLTGIPDSLCDIEWDWEWSAVAVLVPTSQSEFEYRCQWKYFFFFFF